MANKVETIRRGYRLEELFGRILSPFERFLHNHTSGGIMLIGATITALLLANIEPARPLMHVFEETVRIGFGDFTLSMSLHAWINEGLMTLFFLVVGLELKREILVGELSQIRDAALPVFAAAGGMIIPALIYFFFNPAGPGSSGWGVPMATDIAFSIGILVLLSWRIPSSLIIFLTALAIADDLGAVLVIALFYTQELNVVALEIAAGLLALLLVLNQGGIRHPVPYGSLGVLLWFAMLKSGVHSTVSGVLLAFCIPARPAYSPVEFRQRLLQLQTAFQAESSNVLGGGGPLSNPRMATIAENLETASKAVQSPLQNMEHRLGPWVTFLIIPIFALSNVGIDFSQMQFWSSLKEPVTQGVILGLVLGKFIGVTSFSWFAVKVGFGVLPRGVKWRHLMGVAWLAGIGFTMSLFVSQLAFTDNTLLEQSKLGILLASAISATIGLIWLFRTAVKREGNSES